MKYLVLGGINVPIDSYAQFSQSYDELLEESSSIIRMSDGQAIKQTGWNGNKKLKITTSGNGWAPLALNSLDFKSSMVIKCANPRALTDLSNVIAVPAARRSDQDYTPIGFAIVDNELVITSLVMAGDTATLAVVENASAYRVHYFPELTVFVKTPPESWQMESNTHPWSFVAEEV